MSKDLPIHPLSNKLYLSNNDGIHLIDFRKISRVLAASNYSYIFINTGEKFLITKSLMYVEEKLPNNQFMRIHKSHIVRIDSIRFIGSNHLKLDNGEEIPISKTYKKNLLKLLDRIK